MNKKKNVLTTNYFILVSMLFLMFGLGGQVQAFEYEEPLPLGETDVWNWEYFEQSMCGRPWSGYTGIGYSYGSDSTTLLLYLKGGGACWNYTNCALGNTTTFEEGFTFETFQENFDSARNSPFGIQVLRSDNPSTNPLADAQKIFVPYCTGDVHSGDNIKSYGLGLFSYTFRHKGNWNLRQYLARIVPTFPNVQKVIMAGSSAGGLGSHFNWKQVQDAFGVSVEVHVLNDSGTPIMPSDLKWQKWVDHWNIQFPADCTDCYQSMYKLNDYYSDTLLQQNRYGLLAFASDLIIAEYFAAYIGDPQALGKYKDELAFLMETMDQDPTANNHYFTKIGTDHTMLLTDLINPYEEMIIGDKLLSVWIDELVNNTASWKSHEDAVYYTMPPTISIISPAPGETGIIGSVQEIRWVGAGFYSGIDIKRCVTACGSETCTSITTNTEDDGIYSWSVTTPAQNNVSIRVCSSDSSVICAESSGYKVIAPTN